jgi:hypothetical protein
MKMQLPLFPGFYNSALEGLIDDEIEQHEAEDIPPPADGYQYQAARLAICRAWVHALNDELGTSFEFSSLWSPREYNFTSDKITVNAAPADVATLEEMRGTPIFRDVLKRHLTPRDGFCPFYDDDESADEWQRPLAEWDEPQTSLLIAAFIESELGIDSTSELCHTLLSGRFDYTFHEAASNNL